jgi:dihydroxyacetone kinase
VYYPEYNFIYDKSILKTNQVRLVCGGGSGHEPAHGGLVLDRMLTCAVCGDIFSSPSCANIIKAIEEIYSDSGVIVIVKNYQGDIINFSLACELFKSKNKKVEMLIVDDDISLANQNEIKDEKLKIFNKRRGLCGTVLAYKILGTLAKQYYTFEEILEFAKNIIPALYTCGVSVTTCIPPFTSVDKNDVMKNTEYELGLGIHGEKGKERFELKSTNEIIENIFDNCFSKNIEKSNYDKMKDVVIVVNNLGSLTPIEMNIVIKSLFDYLYKENGEKQFNVHTIIYGNIMTSLDMKGFSITIFNLNQNKFLEKYKDKILSLIEEPLNREVGWNIIKNPDDVYNNKIKENIKYIKKEEKKVYNDDNSKSFIYNLLKDLFTYLQSKRDELNDLDKKVGDGDIGTGLHHAMTKILSDLKYLNLEEDFKGSIKKIGEDIGAAFGGTSGPLYMSFLLRASDFLEKKFSDNKIENFLKALKYGTEMIGKVGKAEKGDRTMLDYLINISELFENVQNVNDLKKVFNENDKKLLDDIKKLKCKRGRSSYLDGKEVGLDEPGCVLVSTWLSYIINKI